MTLLNKQAILSAQDLKTEDVAVPEWGGTARVRTLTGTERDAFESGLVVKDGKRDLTNLRARLLSLAIVDENGARLFSETDAALLGGKSAAALDKLFEVAQRLNGIGSAAQDDIAKN
jgi:hypothetical protein